MLVENLTRKGTRMARSGVGKAGEVKTNQLSQPVTKGKLVISKPRLHNTAPFSTEANQAVSLGIEGSFSGQILWGSTIHIKLHEFTICSIIYGP